MASVLNAVDRVNTNLEYKDQYVKSQHKELEKKQERFSLRFDEFFHTIDQTAKRQGKKIKELQDTQETIQHSMEKLEEQVMGSLNSTIKDLAAKHKIDEIRFSDLEAKLRDLPKHEKMITALRSQVSDLQTRTKDVTDLTNFVSKSLIGLKNTFLHKIHTN